MKTWGRVGLSSWLVVALLVAACGGGGGGGGTDALLPTLSQDIEPSGARVDVSTLNLFPLQVGDQWTYDRLTGSTVTSTSTRTVSSGPLGTSQVSVDEVDEGTSSSSLYAKESSGLRAFDPLGAQGQFPGILEMLPSLLEYPTPFYPVGGERKLIRQGSIKADINSDGKADYFRFEFTQTFRGFETLDVLGAPTSVAHFTAVAAFTIAATGGQPATTAVATEEAFWASGIGLVRSERRASLNDGTVVIAPYTLRLRSAVVAGQSYPTVAQSSNRSISLTHAGIVFDASRSVYYASVPGSVVGTGNRIATIDPGTGTVTWSDPIGSDPSALALSADASVLYVGLRGSGEVLKVAVPGMQVLARVSLPIQNFFGQLYAEEISVSPIDNTVFAVSLFRSGTSPRHGGVALVRNMQVQPLRTQDHTGSNRIGFDASGGWLYGLNNETTEFGLRRIEVLADGLAERKVITSQGQFNTPLEVRDGLVIANATAYRADDTMAQLGTISSAANCIKVPAIPRAVCRSTLDPSRLVIAETDTFSLLADAPSNAASTAFSWRLLPGPSGQIGISDGERLVMFSHPSLQSRPSLQARRFTESSARAIGPKGPGPFRAALSPQDLHPSPNTARP